MKKERKRMVMKERTNMERKKEKKSWRTLGEEGNEKDDNNEG